MSYSKQNIFKGEDTTLGIWDILYKVGVPYKYTMSITYLKEYGVPTSGSKDIDREQMNQIIVTYLPIEKMAEYFKEGAVIRLMEIDSARKIYDSISSHLNAWKNVIEYGVNVLDAPYEDLILLDEFANSVYEHAKYNFTPSESGSVLAKALSRFGGFRLSNSQFMSSLPSQIENMKRHGIDPIVDLNSSEYIPAERESLASLFKKSISSINR